MTPKQKALELYLKMNIDSGSWYMDETQLKECALICVDEIIKSFEENNIMDLDLIKYWKEVKEEINKL